jgi:hypothetical protein
MTGEPDDNKPSKFSGQGQVPAAGTQPKPKPTTPPNASKFAPAFQTEEEKKNNIFFSQTKQAIREFRAMSGNENARGPLTREEQKYIREILNEAKGDVKKYKIPLEVAASLRFASKEARVDHTEFMTRMIETGGNISGADPAGMMKTGPFKFNVPTWLYMMKTHGPEHGLDYFAGKISIEHKNGYVTAEVKDPAVLREIISLRDNPRVSAMLGAEYLKHQTELPVISYPGATVVSDPKTKAEQENLMTLGFDLGIRGADGIPGPLTQAARAEFQQMNGPLLAAGAAPKPLDQMIADAAAQAKADSEAFSTPKRKISPADTFGIRHAAKVTGQDFGFMMELAQAESGFKTDVKATTSSATGLYQFIDTTWLIELHRHGEKYGLGDIVKQIEVKKNKAGDIIDADIRDPMLKKYALDLRADPRINSLMGAEFVKENKEILAAALPKKDLNRTDQYLAHFMGSGGAVDFLSAMKKTPDGSAADKFPAEAKSNPGVFQKPDGTDRSLKEVYDFFMKKFYTQDFDNAKAPKDPPPAKPKPKPHK